MSDVPQSRGMENASRPLVKRCAMKSGFLGNNPENPSGNTMKTTSGFLGINRENPKGNILKN
jgi:hypothetical protein